MTVKFLTSIPSKNSPGILAISEGARIFLKANFLGVKKGEDFVGGSKKIQFCGFQRFWAVFTIFGRFLARGFRPGRPRSDFFGASESPIIFTL